MSATGSLVGIGVGPGDPDLITVKGLRALRAAPVLTPANSPYAATWPARLSDSMWRRSAEAKTSARAPCSIWSRNTWLPAKTRVTSVSGCAASKAVSMSRKASASDDAAKTCNVALSEADGGARTSVAVTGKAQVGGTIARVGQRLLGGVSKMMMDRFFACLQERARAAGAGS